MGSSGPALTWEITDGIAVVVLDAKDRPVNTISRAVKDEFVACFEALGGDATVRAVAFFSGKADNFIAGADIEEFVQLSSAAEAERLSADGQDMLDRVARFAKPVVAGIHGACLGGGFEFALACHYRVATDHPKTQIGLPEVQLGLLPGAGACQRLGVPYRLQVASPTRPGSRLQEARAICGFTRTGAKSPSPPTRRGTGPKSG